MFGNWAKRWLRSPNFWFALALLAAIVFVIILPKSVVHGYAFKDKLTEAAAETAAALLTVTLFIERAMASVNAILYGDVQRRAENSVQRAGMAAATDAIAAVLGSKERLRLFGSFAAGLFVSAAGVRTLEGLLETQGKAVPQNPLLFPVDVLLTAGLIAGGSNGLAFLIQLLKNQLAPPPVDPKGEEPVAPPGPPAPPAPPAPPSDRLLATPAVQAAPLSASWYARMTSTG